MDEKKKKGYYDVNEVKDDGYDHFDGSDESIKHNEPQKKVPKYPRSIFFIIGTEFCERFSYYGMKNILTLFFKLKLGFSEDLATTSYHAFSSVAYFMPIIGAIVADSFLGKYKTIFYIAMVYALGNIVLSTASYFVNTVVTVIGLILIAFGTGGIKPCVSAFGGDQFVAGQEQHEKQFFSFFYMSINAGAFISNVLTPELRQLSCLGDNECFPLAFGVPAALMVVAIIMFILGRFITKYIMHPPEKGNIVVQFVKCIFLALGRKISKRNMKRDHWLEYADDTYDAQKIADFRAVLRVLFLFVPLPLFWALFSQQGSRWTLQATRMDGAFFNTGFIMKPDQISIFNSFLVIVFIPIFDYGIYPLFARINLLKKPLQRMVTGGFLAAVAFAICGFLEISLENELAVKPTSGQASVVLLNGLPCDVRVNNNVFWNQTGLDSLDYLRADAFPLSSNWRHFDIEVLERPGNSECQPLLGRYHADLGSDELRSEETAVLFLVAVNNSNMEASIFKYNGEDLFVKPKNAGANVRVFFRFPNSINGFTLENDEPSNNYNMKVWNENRFETQGFVYGDTDYTEANIVVGGDYKISVDGNSNPPFLNDIPLKQGGSYIIVVNGVNGMTAKLHNIVPHDTLSMFLQVIPYFIITAGEVMFSITGLSFSYSQAPASMKSVLTAGWLLTVAFGDLIVIIVASAKFFEKQSNEFFFFCGFMIVDMLLFAVMAYFYIPAEKGSKQKQQEIDYTSNSNSNRKTSL